MADFNRNQQTEDDATTDLPVLATWLAVYAFVLGSFSLWVILLMWLSRAFL